MLLWIPHVVAIDTVCCYTLQSIISRLKSLGSISGTCAGL